MVPIGKLFLNQRKHTLTIRADIIDEEILKDSKQEDLTRFFYIVLKLKEIHPIAKVATKLAFIFTLTIPTLVIV